MELSLIDFTFIGWPNDDDDGPFFSSLISLARSSSRLVCLERWRFRHRSLLFLLLLLFFMIVSPSKHGKWAATMSMVFGDEKVETVTSCRASSLDLYRCFRQMMKNFLDQFFFSVCFTCSIHNRCCVSRFYSTFNCYSIWLFFFFIRFGFFFIELNI